VTQTPFRHLRDERRRARLIDLRNAVAPILANNLLPYFTVHDVGHSDRVVSLLDDLLMSLRPEHILSDEELFVLYASAYLHDLGMQYENVGSTETLKGILRGEEWKSIAPERRRNLLRLHHPAISAELVLASAEGRAASPPIGLQLRQDEDPGAIACLCEAHGEDPASPRFIELTQDRGTIRVRLLVGLLRVADILEESCVRAPRHKAESLMLPLESAVHWWRVYYTSNVTIDQHDRAINVWFDFPRSRSTELREIVPSLQLPVIRAEFENHVDVFAKFGLSWAVRERLMSSSLSTREDPPDAVIAAMLVLLQQQRQREIELKAQTLDGVDRSAESFVQRRLSEIDSLDSAGDKKAVVDALEELAQQVANMGSTISAVPLLRRALARSAELDSARRLKVALELADYLLKLGRSEEAVHVTHQVSGLVNLADSSQEAAAFACVRIKAEHEAGFFEDAINSIDARLIAHVDSAERELLSARRAELELLLGAVAATEREDG
jgi:hypothetical protein